MTIPTSKVAFIGVDLAWQSERNNTGLAALIGDENGVEAVSVGDGATTLDSVRAYILDHREATTVVAIDAPLIIQNAVGQRPCETRISQKFGRADAYAHSSNLRLYPRAGGVELARMLEAQGFRHCSAPGEEWRDSGNWFFEVYPHPGQVVLFGRDRIIGYKKGPVAARRSGLGELRQFMWDRLVGPGRPIAPSHALTELLTRNLESVGGRALKAYEDSFDAIFCAYLAFHLWRWRWDQNELIGDHGSGYIVVPTAALT